MGKMRICGDIGRQRLRSEVASTHGMDAKE